MKQWSATGSPNQRWRVRVVGAGHYRIESYSGGRCLEVVGDPAATRDGARLQLWEWVGGKNQIWRLVKVNRGAVLRQRMQARAYLRWIGRGRPFGRPAEDWMPAETEVLQPVIAVEAWLRYEHRGRGPGGALCDWPDAEREVRGWLRER